MASVRPEFASAPPAPFPNVVPRSGEVPAVREDLSGLLVHDLRTPLSAIAMNLDYVLAGLDAQTPVGLRLALEDCRDANARALQMVSDVADFTHLAVGAHRVTIVEVDTADILDGIIRQVAREAIARSVRIVVTTDGRPIAADPLLFARVLDRLVVRALRHARAGSCLTIDQQNGVFTIRVQAHDAKFDPSARALATCFADAALRAQGASLRTETDGQGVLVYRVTW